MSIELLALRTARKHVQNFERESTAAVVMQEHHDAMECRNCEDFLQLGIDAFHWVMNADCRMRVAVSEGDVAADDSFELLLLALCSQWLVPCAFAEQWIARLEADGFKLDNAEEFRNCRREMSAIVKSFDFNDEEELPARMAELQDQALDAIRNDKTAEFF